MALKEAFKDHFYIGAALSLPQILGKEPGTLALLESHFNSITPENILKWEEIHPEPERYDFVAADRYVALGEKYNMHIIGHTLVWFHQTPDWVFKDESGRPLSRNALLDRMKEHIFTVMGRYKNRIHGWDVVNEAFLSDGRYRPNRWYEIIGEEYIAKAFEYAHEADPNAKLYYNEYDYEYQPKCDAVIRLVRNLQARGIRVDGVGIQGHWFLDYPKIGAIELNLRDLASLGITLMVTELDIGVLPFYPVDSKLVDLASFDPETQKKYNPYPEGLPDSVQQELARRYSDLFALFLKYRDKIGRVTFWAVHDGQSWRSGMPITGRTDYPMLFDRDCKPKPALNAVLKAAR